MIAAASVPALGLCFGPSAEFAIEISSEFVVPNDFHIAVGETVDREQSEAQQAFEVVSRVRALKRGLDLPPKSATPRLRVLGPRRRRQ